MSAESYSKKTENSNPSPRADWDVAIIIVAYEGDAWIPDCMESLKASTQINALVLLIDNKDNTNLISEEIGSLTIRCFKTPHPMGFADANNFALMKVPSSVPNICFLNQDTLSQKKWLEEGLNCLHQNPQLGAVSPMLKNYQGTDWDKEFQFLLKNQPEFKSDWLNCSDHRSVAKIHLVDDIPATAMIVKTEVIKRSGPFDNIFGSYYEDFDLCMRIRKLGYHIAVCPQSILFHYSGSISQTEEARRKRSRWVIRNRTVLKIRSSHGPRWLKAWRHLIINGSLQTIRAILRTPSSSPLRSVAMAHIDLIRILPRLCSCKIDKKKWDQFLEEINWESFATQHHSLNEDFTH